MGKTHIIKELVDSGDKKCDKSWIFALEFEPFCYIMHLGWAFCSLLVKKELYHEIEPQLMHWAGLKKSL